MKLGTISLLFLLAAGCSGGGSDDGGGSGEDPTSLAWAFQSGGTADDEGAGVAALDGHSGVATGTFGNSITLGLDQPDETVLNSLGDDDVFVLHYTDDGLVDWVRHVGGPAMVKCGGLQRFPDGSFVMAGAFAGTLTVGVGRPDALQLTSADHLDVFFARFGADGTLQWAKRAGGFGYEEPRGVATGADGSWFVTGYFQHAITFGPGEPGETTLTATGQAEMFVARYNADGTVAWARGAGGDKTCAGHDVAGFGDGSCVVAVRIDGTVVFGAGEANETQVDSVGSSDVAVARYNADGTLAWARSAGSIAVDTPWGVAAFADGSCVVTGSITNQVTFGAGETNETVLTSMGEWDIFLARYHADGTLAWATVAGGALQDEAFDVAGFPDGFSVITGRIRETATFGAGEAGETVLTSNGAADIFVARYGPDGRLDWAENAGGDLSDRGDGICACLDGSFLVTGCFQQAATFHSGDASEVTLVSVGREDVFVAYYQADGK